MPIKKWVCMMCGYVYESNVPFETLNNDWVCPICGEHKEAFELE